MSFYLSVFLLLLGIPVATGTIPTGGVSRPSYGVDFNFLFQINNMHGSWKHVWTLDINLLDREMPPVSKLKCLDESTPICATMVTFLEECQKSFWNLTSLFSSFNQWVHNPQMLQTLNRGTKREKRSLLPFVGDIEKALFGIATESDINAIQNSINDFTKLGENYKNQMSTLGDNLASLTKMTQEQTANTKKGFDIVKATFSNLTEQINGRIKDLSQKIEHQTALWTAVESSLMQTWPVMEGAFAMLVKTLQVIDADLQLLESLQQILMGYIPITMIPPPSLIEGLRVAENGIRSVFPEARLSYSDQTIGYYYTHQIVTPMIESSRISLIVDIPVDLGQQVLNVYSVRTFPVPMLPYNPYLHQVDPVSKATTAQSELNVKEDYFLVSQDGQSYSTSIAIDISLCKGETIKFCPKQFPLFPMTQISCLQQLWTDATFDSILENCPYRLSHILHATKVMPYVQVRSLSQGKWYINTPLDDKWTISCPSHPPEIRNPCTSCIIQVDCGCGVKSKYFQIPTRLSSCSSVFSPLSRNFTLNPFSYLAKDEPWVVNLTGTTVINHPPENVPNINLPNGENWDDVMESMDHQTYDLNRLYLKQMNETKMFRTEAEALLQKIREQDHFLDAISGWPSWLIGLGLGLSFFNTFGILAICYCLLSRGAHAIPLLKSTRFHAEPSLSTDNSGAILSLEALTLIVCILNLVLLLILSWPIITQWLSHNRYVRQYLKLIPRVKAIGFVKRSGGIVLVIEGTGIFHSANTARPAIFQISIVCMKTGWSLNTMRTVPTSAHCEEEGGAYYIRFDSPIFLIGEDGEERHFEYVPISVRILHEKLTISESFPLTEMTNCKVFIIRP